MILGTANVEWASVVNAVVSEGKKSLGNSQVMNTIRDFSQDWPRLFARLFARFSKTLSKTLFSESLGDTFNIFKVYLSTEQT